MTAPGSRDPMEAALREAEDDLARRIHDACDDAPDVVSDESTAELLRLENALLAAARSAEHAVALRRRRRRSGGEVAVEVPEPVRARTDQLSGVRNFVDATGRGWRVWLVIPGRVRRPPGGGQFLGEYEKGWLAFEAIDGTMRRRLPGVPPEWPAYSEDALRELLERARPVPPRDSETHPPTSG